MAESTTLANLGQAMGLGGQPASAAAATPAKPKLDKQGRAYATGRRKESTARVWVKRGKGKITVNGKAIEQYFARPVPAHDRAAAAGDCRPRLSNSMWIATVVGGGLSGQAGAVRHGIARALTYFEPELRAALKKGGFPHTRQPRGGTQEVWPCQGTPPLPVLEALTRFPQHLRKSRPTGGFFFAFGRAIGESGQGTVFLTNLLVMNHVEIGTLARCLSGVCV